MSAYLGKVHGAFHDFDELFPPTDTPAKELEQQSTFFMLLALYGLSPEYFTNRDQILGYPTLNSAWSFLLQIPTKPFFESDMSPHPVDSFALVSQSTYRGRKPYKFHCPQCDYCHKLGHTIDKCWTLHGHPPCTANVAQVVLSKPSVTSNHPTPSHTAYANFLKLFKEC